MIFTETNELYIEDLRSLFLVFAADEVFFYNTFLIAQGNREWNFLFLHTKDDQAKNQTVRPVPNAGQAT